MSVAARVARAVTVLVVRSPALWPLLRPVLRSVFERLAPVWDERRTPGRLAAVAAGLEALPAPPRHALDVGTGTGDAALAIALRWDGVRVVGVDLSPAMIAAAREKVSPVLAERVEFVVGDAARLPFSDGGFDFVVLANMIPFFDELARVCAPGGRVLICFSLGAETPIYVPPERLRDELSRRRFADFTEIAAGPGVALLARKAATA